MILYCWKFIGIDDSGNYRRAMVFALNELYTGLHCYFVRHCGRDVDKWKRAEDFRVQHVIQVIIYVSFMIRTMIRHITGI